MEREGERKCWGGEEEGEVMTACLVATTASVSNQTPGVEDSLSLSPTPRRAVLPSSKVR